MLGPLPRHPQPAESQTNGFVADQPRREALGKTDLRGQRERPSACGLAKGPRTLVQQRLEGLAGPRVEEHRYRVWPRRLRLEHGEATLVKRMNGVAHGLVGATQMARNRGRRLPLGTGEEYLAAAYCKGGRGPETGL